MGKQRNTSNKNQSHLLLFCMLFPRAIKTIVARWVALEDDGNSEEEEEEEEEEGNSEAEGGENFSVNEVFQLF